jgi:hypothetical protein
MSSLEKCIAPRSLFLYIGALSFAGVTARQKATGSGSAAASSSRQNRGVGEKPKDHSLWRKRIMLA